MTRDDNPHVRVPPPPPALWLLALRRGRLADGVRVLGADALAVGAERLAERGQLDRDLGATGLGEPGRRQPLQQHQVGVADALGC